MFARRLTFWSLGLFAVLSFATRGLAGTTGVISGTVKDEHGAPIASAHVTASSPSQTARGLTIASGFFSMLNLS
ncbi:MAG: carboxypeptidase regulatory-like domain-containing protein, partial [Candidatus Eremiobacteraeota bacterium]|nr:carboxypeptidase regulatory-like domain-containing protein [Candidatus Eremiobacteraeota bacterium]